MDEDLSKKVLLGARTSMGMDVSEVTVNITHLPFVSEICSISSTTLRVPSEKMAVVAPNLGELIGEVVAARLISHAGSLTNLARHHQRFRSCKQKGSFFSIFCTTHVAELKR